MPMQYLTALAEPAPAHVAHLQKGGPQSAAAAVDQQMYRRQAMYRPTTAPQVSTLPLASSYSTGNAMLSTSSYATAVPSYSSATYSSTVPYSTATFSPTYATPVSNTFTTPTTYTSSTMSYPTAVSTPLLGSTYTSAGYSAPLGTVFGSSYMSGSTLLAPTMLGSTVLPSAGVALPPVSQPVELPAEKADESDSAAEEADVYVEVTIDKGNMKGVDSSITTLDPIVELRIGGVTQKSSRKMHTLTPEWDETLTLPVSNPQDDQLIVTVYLGEHEVGQGFIMLSKLVERTPTYKGVAVTGGKLDLTLKAIGFGAAAQEAEGDDSWMEFL